MKKAIAHHNNDSSTGQVRLHARRVAIGATLVALAVYIIFGTIADLVVVGHLNSAIDARLTGRLDLLVHNVNRSNSGATPLRALPTAPTGDLDDTPILAWSVPVGSSSAEALVADAPTLPTRLFGAGKPTDVRIDGRGLRIVGVTGTYGRLIVATSNRQVDGLLSTLLIIEGSLAPVALLSLYIAATVIGRRAAAPIERARLRQLEFTADASHELRTPLSVIEAEVGLALSSDRTASAYHNALERIADESMRLRNIVDDLLWLARLDALPAGPAHEPVDIATIVIGCSDRFTTLAGQRAISLTMTEIGAFPPIVVAPAEWLDRLVSVLLDNACRYANDDGRIEICVSTSEDRVRLIVDDSGPGFRDEEREQLLQRFHRASVVPGGAGLGLAIAGAVVRATDGEIVLAHSPLGGARVESVWKRFQTERQSDAPRARHSARLAHLD